MKLECKSGCGQCCKVGGTLMTLPITKDEAIAVGKALGREIKDVKTVPIGSFSQSFVRAAHCPAYDEESQACTVYDSRPEVCRAFECNGEERFTHSDESIIKLTKMSQRTEEVADIRDFFPESIDRVFARHERIAFQFSGGKDSTATLFYLRKYWHRMTVYFCESGDSMPETIAVVDQVAALLPRFVVIQGRVKEVRAEFGNPTDLLPWTSSHAAHVLNTGYTPIMQDRVACCFRSVMEPMHNRMVADEITLVIRGQKDSDTHKGPLRSGMVSSGIEFFYPLQDWTDEQCFAFMRENGVEPQRFYQEGITHSGDCISCTAWCEDDRASYLKKYYPLVFQDYKKNIRVIADAASNIINNINKELFFLEERDHG